MEHTALSSLLTTKLFPSKPASKVAGGNSLRAQPLNWGMQAVETHFCSLNFAPADYIH
jgi:hypothetical protein